MSLIRVFAVTHVLALVQLTFRLSSPLLICDQFLPPFVVLILMCFQDDTNYATMEAWQDQEESIRI